MTPEEIRKAEEKTLALEEWRLLIVLRIVEALETLYACEPPQD
jgi:hypothetical protein